MSHVQSIQHSPPTVLLCSQYGSAMKLPKEPKKAGIPSSPSESCPIKARIALSWRKKNPQTAASEIRLGDSVQGILTLFQGIQLLQASSNSRLLVATSDVLEPATLQYIEQKGQASGQHFPPLAEGAAALLLGQRDDPLPGVPILFDSLRAPPFLNKNDLRQILVDWLHTKRHVMNNLGQVISGTLVSGAMRSELNVLSSLYPNTEIRHLAWTVGDCGATLGLLSVLSALEESGTTLVMNSNHDATTAILVTRP